MDSKAHFQLMAEYNYWMNQQLYAVCAEMTDEQRKQNLGAFFKSIHGTLNHLLYGDQVWMGRFTQQPLAGQVIGQELYADFVDLRAAREQMDNQILDWSRQLEPQWLSQPFTYTSNVDQQQRILPTWVLVTHMFNHQTHHRGQVTTLITQLGYEPGITDLPWLPSLNPEPDTALIHEWQGKITEANRHNILCHCRHCNYKWIDSHFDATCCQCGGSDVERIACWQFPDD